jgi:hypothetical protein
MVSKALPKVEDDMGHLQILCLAVRLGDIVILQIATKASLDSETVCPKIKQRNDLNAVGRALQLDRLVTDSDGQVPIERHVLSTHAASVELGKLGRRIGIERLQVLHDLGQVHSDLLLLQIDRAEFVAHLAAHLSEAPEGAVRLARRCVLTFLLGAMARLGDGEMEAKLLVLDVGFKRALAIETSART